MSRGKVVDFKLMYDVPDADWQILKERIINQNESFWKRASMNQKSAGGISDKFGHHSELRTKIHPVAIDMIGRIKNDFPQWFKSSGEATRAIVNLGIHFFIAMLPDGQKNTKLEKMEKRLAELTELTSSLRQLEFLKKKRLEIMSNDALSDKKKATQTVKMNILIKELEEEINGEEDEYGE